MNRDRGIRIARGVAHGLGGLLLVYLFVLLLMVLITEESVIVRLHHLNAEAGYTAALGSLEDDEGAIRIGIGTMRRLERQVADAESGLANREIILDSTMRRVRGVTSRFHSSCLLSGDPAEPGAVDWLWSDLQYCVRRNAPPGLEDELNQIQTGVLNPPNQRDEIQTARVALAQSRAELTATRNNLRRQMIEHNALAPTRAVFAEIRALQASGLIGAAFLLNFPPALLQLPLAIVSGAFGALLIRLILLVYPNSGLRTSEAGGIVRRAILGGLVALSVYILMLGGTAVVGASGGLQNQQSNSLTFTAVAILAGMFSDRVAGWLSKRADGFFSGGAKPAAESPVPD